MEKALPTFSIRKSLINGGNLRLRLAGAVIADMFVAVRMADPPLGQSKVWGPAGDFICNNIRFVEIEYIIVALYAYRSLLCPRNLKLPS